MHPSKNERVLRAAVRTHVWNAREAIDRWVEPDETPEAIDHASQVFQLLAENLAAASAANQELRLLGVLASIEARSSVAAADVALAVAAEVLLVEMAASIDSARKAA